MTLLISFWLVLSSSCLWLLQRAAVAAQRAAVTTWCRHPRVCQVCRRGVYTCWQFVKLVVRCTWHTRSALVALFVCLSVIFCCWWLVFTFQFCWWRCRTHDQTLVVYLLVWSTEVRVYILCCVVDARKGKSLTAVKMIGASRGRCETDQ